MISQLPWQPLTLQPDYSQRPPKPQKDGGGGGGTQLMGTMGEGKEKLCSMGRDSSAMLHNVAIYVASNFFSHLLSITEICFASASRNFPI